MVLFDIKMPSSCFECPIADFGNSQPGCCPLTGEYNSKFKEERAENCLLKPLGEVIKEEYKADLLTEK